LDDEERRSIALLSRVVLAHTIRKRRLQQQPSKVAPQRLP
jgi:hypothetical protein